MQFWSCQSAETDCRATNGATLSSLLHVFELLLSWLTAPGAKRLLPGTVAPRASGDVVSTEFPVAFFQAGV